MSVDRRSAIATMICERSSGDLPPSPGEERALGRLPPRGRHARQFPWRPWRPAPRSPGCGSRRPPRSPPTPRRSASDGALPKLLTRHPSSCAVWPRDMGVRDKNKIVAPHPRQHHRPSGRSCPSVGVSPVSRRARRPPTASARRSARGFRAVGQAAPARRGQPRAGLQVNARVNTHLVEHRDKILGRDVAGRTRWHRTSAELTEARLEASIPTS